MTSQKVLRLLSGCWPVALAMVLGAGLAAPASRAQLLNTSKEEIAKEKSAELQALKQRATNLAKRMNGPSSASSMKNEALRDWNKLLSDFDQWAAKFHMSTQEDMLPAYSGGPNGPIPHHYSLLTEGPPGLAGFFCMKDLTRSTDAQFAYRCYKE